MIAMHSTQGDDMEATKQQYEATAKFHDKAAAVFAKYGQHKNAEQAKKAAEICRARAALGSR